MKKKAKRFAEGGFSKEQEEWLGGADRTDPYILARMREAIPDKVAPVKSMEQVQDEQEGYESSYRTPKSVEKTVVKTKVTPSSKFTSISSKDEEGNVLPKDVKKPYIAIPKNAAGLQQFRSDAESPVERLWKSLTESKSQRSKAAGRGMPPSKMKAGGKVSSASKRGDGCAIRGKTKGRMV